MHTQEDPEDDNYILKQPCHANELMHFYRYRKKSKIHSYFQ